MCRRYLAPDHVRCAQRHADDLGGGIQRGEGQRAVVVLNFHELHGVGFIGSTVVKIGEKEVLSGSEFYTSDICVLVPKESGLLDMRSLKNKIIAAPAGAGEERFAKYLANKYKGRAIAFSHVEEATGDIEKGYSQALILDKEYYDAHMDALKNWNCLKVSRQFQNNHKFYKVSK